MRPAEPPHVRTVATVGDQARKIQQRRWRCHDVARSRTARYLRRNQMARWFWPLVALVVLLDLLFDRRAELSWFPSSRWPHRRTSKKNLGRPMPSPDVGPSRALSDQTEDETGEGAGDVPIMRLRLKDGFLGSDTVQVVAFLLRNRGRFDNEVVRAKWARLDRISLPLAVYLREVEADAGWDAIKAEISAAGVPSRFPPRLSPREQRLLALMPEWRQRGLDLLYPAAVAEPSETADNGDEPSDEIKPKGP